MKNNHQLFSIIEPSENLKNSIIFKIKFEEKKRAIYNMAFSFIVSVASVSIAIISIISIAKDAYHSGLSEYLSLIFSDGALIASYWQTYVLSVIESLPIIQISIAVASIGLFIWSINMILLNLRNTRSFIYRAS